MYQGQPLKLNYLSLDLTQYVREYGLVTGLVASTINFLCDIFRDNLWGGDRVSILILIKLFCTISSQLWGSTKLRGEVLDYLGQLVLQVINVNAQNSHLEETVAQYILLLAIYFIIARYNCILPLVVWSNYADMANGHVMLAIELQLCQSFDSHSTIDFHQSPN